VFTATSYSGEEGVGVTLYSGPGQKGFFFVIVRLYFKHCKVQINKDYKVTHYTPFPLSKQKKLANHAKRKKKKKKTLQKT